VPNAILAAAKDKLAELESGRSAGPAPAQAELFVAATSPPSPALQALKAVDPDNLTAREALDWIYQLKQKLEVDN
jgi:DNA mismatch repair protein MutS